MRGAGDDHIGVKTKWGAGLFVAGLILLVVSLLLVDRRPTAGEVLVDLALGLGVIGGVLIIVDGEIEGANFGIRHSLTKQSVSIRKCSRKPSVSIRQ